MQTLFILNLIFTFLNIYIATSYYKREDHKNSMFFMFIAGINFSYVFTHIPYINF